MCRPQPANSGVIRSSADFMNPKPMQIPAWWPLVEGLAGFGCRHLTSKDEIRSAKQLLYTVYYKEQGWNPAPNPSGLRIQNESFEDDIPSAWYGIYHKDQLVCVGRAVVGGNSELERYLSQEEKNNMFQQIDPNLRPCEVNRIACLEQYRGTLALFWLFMLAFYHLATLGHMASIGATHPKLANICAERYGFQRTGMRMKYSKEDPHEIEVMWYRFSLSAILYGIVSFALFRGKRALLGKQKRKSVVVSYHESV